MRDSTMGRHRPLPLGGGDVAQPLEDLREEAKKFIFIGVLHH